MSPRPYWFVSGRIALANAFLNSELDQTQFTALLREHEDIEATYDAMERALIDHAHTEAEAKLTTFFDVLAARIERLAGKGLDS